MARYKYKNLYTWNHKIAYIVGILASDGCLSKDRRHLNVTSSDLEIISNVLAILDKKVKFRIKRSSYGGEAYDLTFSDVALYDFMINTGLTPNKSKSIGILKIPDEYYLDFFRGCFDGDGSIYGNWDKRWPNSLMFYTTISSASPVFLDWLRHQNTKIFGTSRGHICSGSREYSLRYAKVNSRIIFNKMYYQSDLPKLTRKYDKFVAFLSTDPYSIKEEARVPELVDGPA